MSMKKTKEKLHNVAVFDIDSSSIAASCVGYQEQRSVPQKEYWTKRVYLDNPASFEVFFAETIRNLDELGAELITKAGVVIHEVVLVISVPWMSSQKRTIHYARNNPFTFDVKLFNKLVEREINEPLTQNIDYHKYKNLKLIERKTIGVSVNGYPTLRPFETKALVRKVDIEALISVMSVTTYEAFTHSIERTFHQEPRFISNTHVLYEGVKTFIPQQDESLVLDIGGTNTQVLVIRNDKLMSLASFACGEHHILEHLVTELKISFQKARSLLELYTREALDDAYRNEIEPVVEKAFSLWMRELYGVCSELSTRELLPPTLVITASGHIRNSLRFFILKDDELAVHMHSKYRPQIIDLAQLLGLQADQMNIEHLRDVELVPALHVLGKQIDHES